MVATNTEEVPSTFKPEYDRLSELKAFDETKEGVKGLVDAGVTQIPLIDLQGISKDSVQRKEIVGRVGDASQKLGFFQVVNHGIPVSVLEDMKDGARRFFEQETELFGTYPPNPEELPEACRKEMILYSKQVMELGVTLLELLSEALGLDTDHLKEMECGEGLAFICHYYPACPQPELTLGTTKHTDNDFFTVLLQDHIGGLQVFHEDKWVDVPCSRSLGG
ncbi:hypothetical protein FNV43_RR01164 [Rhamnella rubrinervis]|uniref:Uncharacterized protein n=1 Tax=Rhamnella rubrinervis TaxID=2594499 RepID=A0A8K0HP46_9ROSA|nr:hypothetical protein FNV43_RR01164 [Rhamnella rubrinervis]